jgi:hypothetical protein
MSHKSENVLTMTMTRCECLLDFEFYLVNVKLHRVCDFLKF